MEIVFERISKQTVECAYFIQEYMRQKHFGQLTLIRGRNATQFIHLFFFSGSRLVKNVFSDATGWVESYNQAFENLLQEFRDKAVRDTFLVVHRIWKEVDHLGASLCIFSVTPT
jgi:hypothetical protein